MAEKDSFDDWQYRIFRIVLFILFLAAAYRLLDSELHLSRLISGMLGM